MERGISWRWSAPAALTTATRPRLRAEVLPSGRVHARGGSGRRWQGTNQTEAAEVVKAMADHARAWPDLSLGMADVLCEGRSEDILVWHIENPQPVERGAVPRETILSSESSFSKGKALFPFLAGRCPPPASPLKPASRSGRSRSSSGRSVIGRVRGPGKGFGQCRQPSWPSQSAPRALAVFLGQHLIRGW
jgi:hypothetical protein